MSWLLETSNELRLVKDPIDDGKSVSWLMETSNELRLKHVGESRHNPFNRLLLMARVLRDGR